jgi:paraquat-inducible protein B
LSKKANPKVIGGFVVGAIAILVVGLLTFGSGKVFERTFPAVMFFEESVAGLSAGAPLTFQGVTVGSVTEVGIQYNADTLEIIIPVFIDLVPARIIRVGAPREETGSQLDELIELGFRAQLVAQSLVTGQLVVNLDFHPDTPVRMVGVDFGAPEIPTIKSGLASLKETIDNLPVQELVDSAIDLIDDLDAIAESEELKSSLVSLAAGLEDFRQIMATVNAEAEPILENVREGTEDANELLIDAQQTLVRAERDMNSTTAELRELLDNIEDEVRPLSRSVQDAAASATGAFDQIKKTTKTVDEAIAEDSPLRVDLEAALRNLAAASRSIRVLTEQLQRDPSAVLRGRR